MGPLYLVEKLTSSSDKEDGLDPWRNAFRAFEYDPEELFILHVAFLAKDQDTALDNAEMYVEALSLLRLEVDNYTARVSRNGDFSTSMPTYCGALGPDPTDICIMRCNHLGPHGGPGASDQWADDPRS